MSRIFSLQQSISEKNRIIACVIENNVITLHPNYLKRKSTMKGIITAALALAGFFVMTASAQKPWDNGKLRVSDNHHYLIHENGTPFFWLGNTAWLMPERLNRDEVEFYLTREH